MNLIYQWTEFQSLLTDEFEVALPHPIYPKPNGILPFGHTINGDTIFWVTTNSPSEWALFFLPARSLDIQHYAGNIVDFIADLLEGKIDGEVISSDLIDLDDFFDPRI